MTAPSTREDRDWNERIYTFARSLAESLIQLKESVDKEAAHLNESREPSYPFPRDPDIGLYYIESAAQEAEWFEMIGLAVAVQESITRRDSISLEVWAEHEAKQSAANREKRQAAKRRRLERAAAQSPEAGSAGGAAPSSAAP